MRSRSIHLLIASFCMSSAALAQNTAPTPAVVTSPAPADAPKAPATPEKFPGPHGTYYSFPTGLYDEAADPLHQLGDAMAQARREHKRVLIMWGENYCSFCIFLQDILKNDPNVSPIVKSEYVWIKIDLGKGFSRNQQLAEQYEVKLWTERPIAPPGVNSKMMGAPALCVIDPVSGTVVGSGDPNTGLHSGVMGGNDMTARPMTQDHVFDETVIRNFLLGNKAPSLDAAEIIAQAQKKAARDNKPLLVLFTLPLDPASDGIWAWMGQPEVRKILEGAFVPVLVDTERTENGIKTLKAVSGAGTEGKPKMIMPPYLVQVDASGKAVGEAMLTGLPTDETETKAFVSKLAKLGKLTESDQKTLIAAFASTVTSKPAEPEAK